MQIRPGRNIWVFARTDIDAPQAASVVFGACQLMASILPGVALPGFAPFPSPKYPDADTSRYYLGPARPLDIRATQERPPPPRGLESWNYTPGTYAITGERPWYAICDFDWRGPTETIADWPRRKTNFLGFNVDDPLQLDWLLLHAAHMGAATRPDSDLIDDLTGKTKDVAYEGASMAAGLGLGLAALAVVVYFSTHGRK